MVLAFFLRTIGVFGVLAGIGGLAGYTDLDKGFFPSMISMVVGILCLYYDWKVSEERKEWKRFEERYHKKPIRLK